MKFDVSSFKVLERLGTYAVGQLHRSFAWLFPLAIVFTT